MHENFTSDTHLLDAMRLNDTKAFEEIFNRHWLPLYRYAYRKLNSEADAKVITRNIFTNLWENRLTIPVDFSLVSYLYSGLRKDVTKHLYKKICEDNSVEFSKRLTDEFSLKHLKTAYLPVVPKAVNESATSLPVYMEIPSYYSFKKRISDGWAIGIRIFLHNIPPGMRKTFL